jgi:hypothetical protein
MSDSTIFEDEKQDLLGYHQDIIIVENCGRGNRVGTNFVHIASPYLGLTSMNVNICFKIYSILLSPQIH